MSDHGPVCMCHCIFFGINPRVSKHHAFRLYRGTETMKNEQSLAFIMQTYACIFQEQNRLETQMFLIGQT